MCEIWYIELRDLPSSLTFHPGEGFDFRLTPGWVFSLPAPIRSVSRLGGYLHGHGKYMVLAIFAGSVLHLPTSPRPILWIDFYLLWTRLRVASILPTSTLSAHFSARGSHLDSSCFHSESRIRYDNIALLVYGTSCYRFSAPSRLFPSLLGLTSEDGFPIFYRSIPPPLVHNERSTCISRASRPRL